MRPSRFLILANPASGKGRGRRLVETVAGLIQSAGCSLELEFVTQRGQAALIAQDRCAAANPPDCIVAGGGDGTVQEVAGTLAAMQSRMGKESPVLGLAPAGRCNDFSTALGIAAVPGAIASTLLSGEARPIDLGRANGRYYCTVAALGIDAKVSSFVDQMKLPIRGTLAYLYGTLRVLVGYRPARVRLEGDFGVIERPLFLASCANTPVYGGNMRIAPQADPGDGLLDLCLIEPVSRIKAVTLLPKVMSGAHARLPIVQFVRAQSVRVSSEGALEVWADGELLTQTPATIEAVPAAVRVLVPRGV